MRMCGLCASIFLSHYYSISFTEEKLAESAAANAALSGQLENISPQLSSLETALSTSRQKLRDEQKLRRAAEQAQDEADQRVREMEQSLQTLREECDDVHEELAFKENELEETRLELEVEKQQLENELATMRRQLEEAAQQQQTAAPRETATTSVDDTAAAESEAAMDEAYVKKLEEELELVTEQLIETEKRLSESEADLQEKEQQIHTLQAEGRRNQDDEDLIGILQTELSDLQQAEQKLRDELAVTREDLALSREELALQQEELQAAEHDSRAAAAQLQEERAQHQEALTALEARRHEAEITSQASQGEAALVERAVKEINEQNQDLVEQVARLENALENAKQDYQNVLDELDAVNARFDEVRLEGERKGREAATEEIRSQMQMDAEHEIHAVKESLNKLSEDNKLLQTKVDEAEMALAAARDTQSKERQVLTEEKSQVVQQLQAQLARTKEDLARKDKEMSDLESSMEGRLAKAEETVTVLESELHTAKGQLAEAEAHLIVLRREGKERDEELARKSVSPRGTAESSSVAATEEMSSDNEGGRPASPSSVMRLEQRLAEETKKYETLEKKYHDVQDQSRIGEVRIKRLEEDVKILQKQLFASDNSSTVATQMSRLSSMGSTARGMDVISEDEGQRLHDVIGSRDVKRMAEELKALELKCNSQREYNAQLLSKMLHLQGNIQVYCRVRPMSLSEIQSGARSVVESLSETEVGCFDERTNKWKSFNFDRVWGPDQSQTSIFQDVEPLALSVVDGFNACIFAYGQTGSG